MTKNFQLAIDAGGTMTDAILIDDQGIFTVGKYLTNPDDESVSYMGAVQDAAESIGLSSSDVHKRMISDVYAGTLMLNLLITGRGKKVGLLTSIGQQDTPFLERGLTWLGRQPYDKWRFQLHQHSRPLIQVENVIPITERVSAGNYFPSGTHYEAGQIVIPLNEAEVSKAVEKLLNEDVEVIGICFLNSFANPSHEHRAKSIALEIVRARAARVNVICSVDICPRAKESTRTKTLLVECTATDKVREGFFRVENAAKSDGLSHNLQTLLGYGAAADIRYPRLFESVVSGPVGGVLGAKAIAKIIGRPNMVCGDLGGTSWDVGMLIDGELSLTSEPEFSGHRLNMSMVKLECIGGGAGTEIHVDPVLKRIILGPDSAGYQLGMCLKHHEITISDVNVALGLLGAKNFLGGKVHLDREAAIRALDERLARPLGMDVYDAAEGVLDLQHAMLRDHLGDCVLSRGFDPGNFTLLVYGGSGPLHLWGIERNMKLGGIVTVPWAAAFSAFGVSMADYFHRYERSVACPFLPSAAPDEKLSVARRMNDAWQELEDLAYEELTQEGYGKEEVTLKYGVSARYVGQLFSSWSAEVRLNRVKTVRDVEDVCNAFETAYRKIYPDAARFPEAGYLVTGVHIDAMVQKVKPKILEYPLKSKVPSKTAHKGERKVRWNKSWESADIWDMDRLQAGNRVDGPAVIEHSMTTLPIPPGKCVEFDERRMIWYKDSY